ncbi:MAG: hypothetical protein KDA47_17170, partial [Planctomycetales bacterium]|nr:hypothetical protein [Planctomycetales bacterium]
DSMLSPVDLLIVVNALNDRTTVDNANTFVDVNHDPLVATSKLLLKSCGAFNRATRHDGTTQLIRESTTTHLLANEGRLKCYSKSVWHYLS